jgi:hypothetical protein
LDGDRAPQLKASVGLHLIFKLVPKFRQTKGSFMTKETENEALDKIQDIANILSTYDVPTDVQEGLRIIEALASTRDISRVNPNDDEWLARMKCANQSKMN